jgi:hypothetical protein
MLKNNTNINKELTMIVPAADAALAVAYSPAQEKGIWNYANIRTSTNLIFHVTSVIVKFS